MSRVPGATTRKGKQERRERIRQPPGKGLNQGDEQMKVISQIRHALSNIVSRLRLFRHYTKRGYEIRTAINLSRGRVKEMRAVK